MVISQIASLPEVKACNCSSVTLLSKGSPTKPDLFRLDFDGKSNPVVFKTYALKNAFIRATAGWFVTRREYAILKLLEGVEGIERTAFPPSRCGVFLRWVPGTPLYKAGKEFLSDDIYRRLAAVVEQMHHAGVVHLDIAHRGNILVTPDGYPVLIDFQSALYVKHWPACLQKWLWKIDDLTVLKWKKKRFPHLIRPEDERADKRRRKLTRWWPWSHGNGKKK